MKQYLYDVMYEHLPYELRDSVVYQNILKAYANMFDMAWKKVEQAARNIYVDTAVEILPTHSRDIDISIKGMSDEDAREVIRSAWLSIISVVQWDDIIEVINAYSRGDAVMHRMEPRGHYEIEFTSVYGIPAQMGALEIVLKRMVGAEYTWDYKYLYIVWDDRDAFNMTWSEWDILDPTWSEWDGMRKDPAGNPII